MDCAVDGMRNCTVMGSVLELRRDDASGDDLADDLVDDLVDDFLKDWTSD